MLACCMLGNVLDLRTMKAMIFDKDHILYLYHGNQVSSDPATSSNSLPSFCADATPQWRYAAARNNKNRFYTLRCRLLQDIPCSKSRSPNRLHLPLGSLGPLSVHLFDKYLWLRYCSTTE